MDGSGDRDIMYTVESVSLGSSCLCFGLYPSFSKQCVRKRALGSRITPLPPGLANSTLRIRHFFWIFYLIELMSRVLITEIQTGLVSMLMVSREMNCRWQSVLLVPMETVHLRKDFSQEKWGGGCRVDSIFYSSLKPGMDWHLLLPVTWHEALFKYFISHHNFYSIYMINTYDFYWIYF